MKAREVLLALGMLSAVARAAEPDWFDAFRGKAYLQADTSYVAREKSAAPDSPPLFRLRWLVLRFGGFSETSREFWPYRNLILLTMPSGTRYVLESSFGFVDERHLEEERPSRRVVSARAAFEVWTAGGLVDPNAPGDDPCEGMREKIRAPGGSLDFILNDLSSRTVRATLADITGATFDADERRDLATLLRVSPDSNPSVPKNVIGLDVRSAIFATTVAFRNEVPPVPQRTIVLAPDAEAPGDLAAWRGLARLPLDLPPFPAIVPENPIR